MRGPKWRVLMIICVVMILGDKGNVQGYPEEDLVVGLPGQPKTEFRQFAGYVDVDVKSGTGSGRSLFYYFTEADGEPEKKPLTLWLNGGIFLLFSPSLFCFSSLGHNYICLLFLRNSQRIVFVNALLLN